MTYDGMSRKTSMTDANGHQTFYVYDLRGHLIETDYADGDGDARYVRHPRAADGQQGPDGRDRRTTGTTPRASSSASPIRWATSPSTATTPNGNLTSVTDANEHVTTYGYDAANRKTSRTLPLGMTETVRVRRRRQRHQSYRLPREDSRRTPSTTVIRTVGRQARSLTRRWASRRSATPTTATAPASTMTDASGTTTYTYDLRNRLHTKATPEGTLTYTYDASGNVASIDSSNANGTSVAYAWDAANQLLDGDGQPARWDDDGGLHGYGTAVHAVAAERGGRDVCVRFARSGHVNGVEEGDGPTFASLGTGTTCGASGLSSTEVTGREAAYGYDDASRLTSETITGDPSGPSGNGALTYAHRPCRQPLVARIDAGGAGARSRSRTTRTTS